MMNQKLHFVGSAVIHGNPHNNYYIPHAPTTVDSLLLPPPALFVPETTFPSPLPQPAKEAADSGLTSHNDIPKRCREYYDSSSMMEDYATLSQRPRLLSSLLEREAAVQIQHQTTELDCLVALHTQRLRTELEERVRQRSKVLVSAVREAATAALREKDEEISRLSKLNWALQERIRALCVENELWRGLAQTNEAAAKSLRTDLERVLNGPDLADDRKDPDDDAGSCCGSNDGAPGEEDDAMRRGCKGDCGGRNEAGVMVMPCRHLCLCTTCGSGGRQSCPVCGSAITASIHVNFSSTS